MDHVGGSVLAAIGVVTVVVQQELKPCRKLLAAEVH